MLKARISENKREYSITDSVIKIKDYRKNKLWRSGEFYGFTSLKNLDEFIWFNTNKQYERHPKLKTENRKGVVKYYTKEGEISSEELFIDDKVKFIQLWNNGQAYLTNGSGKFVCDSDLRNEKLVRVFKDSMEVEGYIVRELKNDTIYHQTDTKAYPKTGLKPFYNDLAKNINYPKLSNFLGIDKKITIQFVVDEAGNLTDFIPLNNESLNFEKNAIKKLERMPKWIPATINGRNVKTRFRIPITFKN